MTAAPTQHYSEHIPALDGLRGYAALVVTFYHAILLDNDLLNRVLIPPIQSVSGILDQSTKVALLACNGATAVILFFVLSGLVLHQSLMREPLLNMRIFALFIMRRLLRIYPAMIAVIAGLVVTAWMMHDVVKMASYPTIEWKNAVGNALLMHSKLHGASASVQVEVLAIPFFLLFAYVYRRFAIGGALLLAALTFFALEASVVIPTPSLLGQNFISFALGMLIATPLARPLFSGASDRLIAFALFGGLAGAGFLSMHLISSQLGKVAFMALLVGAIRYGNAKSRSHRFLELPISQLLGRISYSYYLWNVLFIWIVVYTPLGGWFDAQLPNIPAIRGLIVGLGLALATLPVAYLSERWIERPFIHLGRRWTNALKGRAEYA